MCSGEDPREAASRRHPDRGPESPSKYYLVCRVRLIVRTGGEKGKTLDQQLLLCPRCRPVKTDRPTIAMRMNGATTILSHSIANADRGCFVAQGRPITGTRAIGRNSSFSPGVVCMAESELGSSPVEHPHHPLVAYTVDYLHSAVASIKTILCRTALSRHSRLCSSAKWRLPHQAEPSTPPA